MEAKGRRERAVRLEAKCRRQRALRAGAKGRTERALRAGAKSRRERALRLGPKVVVGELYVRLRLVVKAGERDEKILIKSLTNKALCITRPETTALRY